MKKWFGALVLVGLFFVFIASDIRSLGAGDIFTSHRTNIELQAEGGNSLLWGISNVSSHYFTAEVKISADGYSKSYTFSVPAKGSYGSMEESDFGEPVKWKANGKISFNYYGSQEVNIAEFSITPSRLEEDEGVDLPRP